MTNHRVNARAHQLPECPECGVPALCACRNAQGFVCAPHRSRERVAAGELFVITAADARRVHKINAVRELVAECTRETRKVPA